MINVFQYEPNVKLLAFTTEKGHLSGTLMKNIDFRLPNEILALKEKVDSGLKTGDVFVSRHTVFVVLRKHYNTKIKLEDVDKMLSKISADLSLYHLKTTNEDYPQLQELLIKHIPHLQFADTSAWGV
jgi:hypothetical protein